MAGPFQRSLIRKRVPLAMALSFFAVSLMANYGALEGVGYLLEPGPWEPPPKEEMTIVELTEPETPEAEEKKEEELEQEKEEPPKPLQPKKKKEEELVPLPEPEPEPEPQPEPEPEPEEEPPPPQEMPPNMKMVEQLDQFDEKEAPTDAEYLSNINRDVTEQTRAEVTNLQQDAEKAQAMQLELVEDTAPGTAAEDQIAQVEEQKSQLNREAPNVKPQEEEARAENQEEAPEKMLAMKEQAELKPIDAQEKVEELAREADDGIVEAAQEQTATVLEQEQRSRVDRKEKVYKFRLSQHDMAALYGKDLNAKKDIVSRQQSKKKGIWDDAKAHYQSPLENMVPEVQVGNQTALRSRKHPFARYIATMHRGIHESFAYGFLEQLDGRPASHPMNDYRLWSRVEIVLLGDGRIESVKTIRWSGNSAFDAAAREIVWAQGPYPNPPAAIKSGNGKVYMHWTFHRDERACGTFGVTPYILDNAGQGDVPDPNAEVVLGGGRGGQGRRLSRGGSGGGGGRPAASGSEGPGLPPGFKPGGHGGHSHAPAPSQAGGAGAGGGRPGGSRGGPLSLTPRTGKTAGPTSQPQAAETVDPEAKKVASAWLWALKTGDVAKMVSRSRVPFKAGGSVVAKTRDDLDVMLRNVVAEASGTKTVSVQVYTAAGLRRQYGSVPAGVQEGAGRLYGVAKVGGDTFILVMEKSFGSWRVSGIAR